ncbi:MAG: MFS transporter, partial [Burkholderiales bacterium]|nr:MFS transporter [Burkholderiales bacterium]
MTEAPGRASASDVDKTSNRAALTLALTLPGDVVLYLLLPIYAAEFGVSLVEAGLLLASNRLVRIVGYGWVARFYERHGPGPACTLAAAAAAAATLSYALMSGVALLLIGRLTWGLAFAALNIATQALATAEPVGAARRNGVARSIIACGPMLGLLAGATLALWVGPRPVFVLLALVALLAIPLARRLPSGPAGTVLLRQPRLRLP